MGRIRSIKPEFPQSESIGKLTRDARLLFIELWTIVDDDGRTRAASRMLASLLFPYDDDAPSLIEAWLVELEANGFIERYEVDGAKYLQVNNWLKHQKIDHPSKSKLPGPPEVFASPREPSRILAPDLGEDQDKDQDKKEAAAARASEGKAKPKTLEARCRELVGQEPVCCATDFQHLAAMLDQGMTEADVLTGISEGLAKADADYKFRYWRNFTGWVRTAAKNRLDGKPRSSAVAKAAKPPDNPDDTMIDFPGGFRRSTSFVVSALAKWQSDARSWPIAELSAPPDSPGCRVPKRLLKQAGIVSEEVA